MPRSHPQYRAMMERAAKGMHGQFDHEVLYSVIWNTKNTSGQSYKMIPSANVIKSLLRRSAWARPVGEHSVLLEGNRTTWRTLYVYDPSYGEQRKVIREAAVSA